MDKYYTVVIEKNALKQLSKIDPSQRILLLSYIKKNLDGTSNPRATGKPLKGNLKDYWRYRIGNFRIIADIVDQEVRIIIIDIGHRKEVYENY
ncbi:type II toxin-antitoxin system RelE/ParE family toxin [Gudongella oleilytica]|uniref:type II toxin-antitoxin system RelE family toxin n=1 Tax=Gudongella oleilytica TaxID=1582259 RepID=UPI002A35CFAB|nr:type II toxin-antitoxin system RelE/ParE family toxin [Gudongella oleilytica]MDY0257221.1 type II toxin-antitoxin system RelE/ParE family toxin [Gudongella oleilytica]